MNGPQDVGGRHGFGPLILEQDEPLFHAPWEKRALAVTLAAGAMGHWSIDQTRWARENRAPAEYYATSYYKLWILAVERLLVEHGLVRPEELAEGKALFETVPPKRVLKAQDVAAVLARGAPVDRDPGPVKPRFDPGDLVRTRNLQPPGHIRLPAYARDKVGRIEALRGYHVFADASARGDEGVAHWLYTVVFDARTLWGDDAAASDTVSIDAWEPYLEHV
ncbi:nitrile hydratase subunit beta [Xanthobacter dioxanivorans]|uniref:Nitrile hydratase subunit beta n=1 Tax=Xanthobacter dioxanivorans TaxID=2528964 RepID=A0A974SL55_9HYPH|nr:nitrile hydratase subunit beta [Xanthobacter dioxanivorans]QRG08949.1 nitrile hydratase subunit beta [Xanthobacter dioxanivorans]